MFKWLKNFITTIKNARELAIMEHSQYDEIEDEIDKELEMYIDKGIIKK